MEKTPAVMRVTATACALCRVAIDPLGEVHAAAPLGSGKGDRCCSSCFENLVTPAANALANRAARDLDLARPKHAARAAAAPLAVQPTLVSEYDGHDPSRSSTFRVAVVPPLPQRRLKHFEVDVVLIGAPGLNVAFGGNKTLRDKIARMLDDVSTPAETTRALSHRPSVRASAAICKTTHVACVTADETIYFERLLREDGDHGDHGGNGAGAPVATQATTFAAALAAQTDRRSSNNGGALVELYERASGLLLTRYERLAEIDKAKGRQRAAAIVLVTDGAWTTAYGGNVVHLDDEGVPPSQFLTPAYVHRVVDSKLAPYMPVGACGLYAITGPETRPNYFEHLVHGRGLAASVDNAHLTADVTRAFNRVFGDILGARAPFCLRAVVRRAPRGSAPVDDGADCADYAACANDACGEDVSITSAHFGLLTPATHAGKILEVHLPAAVHLGDDLVVTVDAPADKTPLEVTSETHRRPAVRFTARVPTSTHRAANGVPAAHAANATFRKVQQAVEAMRPATAPLNRFKRKHSRPPSEIVPMVYEAMENEVR